MGRIEVVGNPLFDSLARPRQWNADGQYWLWVTRPHVSQKCCSPSRLPREGLDIFAGLCQALRQTPGTRLLIKPHFYDYSALYAEAAAERGLADRIELTDTDLHQLLPAAKVVISEDSTAGMEAMFWGKALVHAHLAASPATVRFAESGAALAACSIAAVPDAVTAAEGLSHADRDRMFEAQRFFLDRHAGPCDGRSTERCVELIRSLA